MALDPQEPGPTADLRGVVHAQGHIEFRLRTIRAGIALTVLLALAAVAHVLTAQHAPHRLAIVLIASAAILDGCIVSRLPHRRMAEAGRLDLFLMGWNATHVLAIASAAILDGGIRSPFVAMFFVSTVFAALALPPKRQLLISCCDVAGLLAVALASGDEAVKALLPVYITAILILARLCATIAGELYDRLAAVGAAREETATRLARAVEMRDWATGGHIDRIATYVRVIATGTGLPPGEIDLVVRASPMHDVGKIAVPDAVLLKPGPLGRGERDVMERHAQAGYDLLGGSSSDLLEMGALIARTHHERFDGSGYPRGLRGEEIPLAGRIVAVADVFDALTTDRVYREAMGLDEAVASIRAGRGTHFDPRVVDAFVAALPEIRAVAEATTLPAAAELGGEPRAGGVSPPTPLPAPGY
jgi:hypothetical protein